MSYQAKLKQLEQKRASVKNLIDVVDAKEKNLRMLESQTRQGLVPTENARALELDLTKKLGPLAPGNVGEFNKVIWPFWFSTELPQAGIGAGETFQTSYTVTLEAAFIMMSMVKVVYQTNVVPWNYLDPNQDGLVGMAPGLSFTMRDSSSQRQFFGREATLVGNVGNPRFPTKFPRPMMLLPNQMMEINFINNHASNEYAPVMTFFGYRLRAENVDQYLSLIHA